MAEEIGIRSVTRLSVKPSSEREQFVEDLTFHLRKESYAELLSWEIFLRGSNLVALELVIDTDDPAHAEYITDLVVARLLKTFTGPKNSAYHNQVTRGSNRLTPA